MSSVLTSNEDTVLFRGVRYEGDPARPFLQLGEQTFSPLAESFTLQFDLKQRYCLGWHDLETSAHHDCPDQAATDPKYDTCAACQKRTGFNPAFYHAVTISPQQQQLNQEPHILYLSYFGDDYLKVGISRARRGVHRLLEQGARSGLVLDTFATALIARQYEAKIASLPQFHETTTSAKKRRFLEQTYDANTAATQLLAAKDHLEQTLAVKFSAPKLYDFTQNYFSQLYTAETFTQPTDTSRISGACLGVVGDILIMQHDNHRLALPLKQLRGYRVAIYKHIIPLDFLPIQSSLF